MWLKKSQKSHQARKKMDLGENCSGGQGSNDFPGLVVAGAAPCAACATFCKGKQSISVLKEPKELDITDKLGTASCNLFTFLKWAQSNCTPIFPNSLCKIKASWKPVWGHQMPSLAFSSVPVKMQPKSPGFREAEILALTAFYFLNTVQLQQHFLPVSLDLTSHFPINTKHNVSRGIKHFQQGPVLQSLWEWQYQIMNLRQMFSRCAEHLT